MDEKKFLADWISHFLHSRNAIFRTIESIGPHDRFDLHVKHKTKDQYVIAEPEWKSELLQRLSPDLHLILVGFNTQANFQFLLDNWKQLTTLQNLTIYFINPQSEPDTKWVISPYVHQRICDSASLKTGLKAMFDTVQPLTPDRIKILVKKSVEQAT